MDGWQYQFPEIVTDASLPEQVAKVYEETTETVWALHGGNIGELAMELMDIVQAAETALRMVGISDLDAVKRAVIAKNAVRGYYGGAS